MRTAGLVPTPELVAQMTHEKPAGWAWAAFASVVFQRWAILEERKIAAVVGRAAHPAGRLRTGAAVAEFVTRQMRAADDIITQMAAYLRTPEFASAFGTPDDESTADAERIVEAAHCLGDQYGRLLDVAENCRRRSVSGQYHELLDDCIRFVNGHLQDLGGLVNDVLERHDEIQRRLLSGGHPARLDPIRLHPATDDQLVWSLLDRLDAIT